MICERPELRRQTSFVRDIIEVALAAKAGATYPQNEDFLRYALEAPRSPRASPNPSGMVILSGILNLFPDRRITRTNLYDSPLWHKKSAFFTTWVALSDQHTLPLDEEIFSPPLAQDFVNGVIREADELHRQITVLEQLQIVMGLVNNQLLMAFLISHSGCRAIARGTESRVGFSYALDDLKKWSDCVSYFPYLNDGYGDPPGDTYHVWGQVIAGLLSSRTVQAKDLVWNALYKVFIPNTSLFTRNFRRDNSITPSEIFHHALIDKIGFRLGQTLARSII